MAEAIQVRCMYCGDPMGGILEVVHRHSSNANKLATEICERCMDKFCMDCYHLIEECICGEILLNPANRLK